MTQMEQVRNKCKEVYATVLRLYGLDLTNVRISFDLRGKAAGKASGKRYADPVISNYSMKFNRDMLTREAFDHVLNNTVPHEIAHIVCFIRPELGKNHDSGWARVCRSLGGSANRTHSEEVVFGKGTTYEYTTDRGHKVRVSDKHHRYLQAGGTLRYRGGKGSVTRASAHQIVGYQGRTLAQPGPKVEAKPVTPPSATTTIETLTRERAAQVAAGVEGIGRVIGGLVLRPVQPAPAQATFAGGQSKAAIARSIMLAGHRGGQAYETIIAAIMQATGHDRQLARATFKANAHKVGIPSTFGA